MKWFKINIKNLLSNNGIKKILYISNIALYVIVFLFVVMMLGGISYVNNQINNNIYPFANNALTVENFITLLFLGVFILSLFLNKKLMAIIWIIAFYQMGQIFLILPELKKVQEIEICMDVADCGK